MLLNDAYAGHRRWWRTDWEENPALASVWTEWDFILLRVYQYIEDYTTQNGHLSWIEEDPDVGWEIDKVPSYFEKAMHEYREGHEVREWETLRAKPIWENDIEPPSMEKWIARLEEGAQSGFPAMPEGGTPRPPTPEELAAMMRPEG